MKGGIGERLAVSVIAPQGPSLRPGVEVQPGNLHLCPAVCPRKIPLFVEDYGVSPEPPCDSYLVPGVRWDSVLAIVVEFVFGLPFRELIVWHQYDNTLQTSTT